MKKRIMVKGKTPTEKINHIEKIINQLARRSHKSVGVHVAPIPLSFYIEKPDFDGKLMQIMCSVPGKLNFVGVQIDTFGGSAKNVDLTLTVISPIKQEKVYLSGRKTINKMNVNIPVSVGTKIILSMADPTVDISDIWFIGLINIVPKTMQLHSMIVDNMEELNERIEKDLADEEGTDSTETDAEE